MVSLEVSPGTQTGVVELEFREGLEPCRIPNSKVKANRHTHDPQLKARVAHEAPKGLTPTLEITKEYGIHPEQVSDRKRAPQPHA
jgi:hypothetical protein